MSFRQDEVLGCKSRLLVLRELLAQPDQPEQPDLRVRPDQPALLAQLVRPRKQLNVPSRWGSYLNGR